MASKIKWPSIDEIAAEGEKIKGYGCPTTIRWKIGEAEGCGVHIVITNDPDEIEKA